MKRASIILLAFGLCLSAFGQPFTVGDLAFLKGRVPVSPSSPTNLPDGYSAFTWYEPSLGYATNAGVATLSNLTSFGATYNLVNATAASFPLREAAQLNGLDTLYFGGTANNRLSMTTYTNTQPYEVCAVFSLTNIGVRVVCGGTVANGAPGGWDFQHNGIISHNVRCTTGGPHYLPITNRYIVVNLVYNGASTTAYTNNVQGATVATTGCAASQVGLRWGCDYQPGNGARTSLACLITFTNQTLNSAARLALYQYCTNRFAIVP